MLPRRDEPFPFEAVRDLIGLVRAMHRAARAANAGHVKLRRIEAVGRALVDAYELAAESKGNTVGHRAAWQKAEAAAIAVADLVEVYDPAEPIVRAAAGAVRRKQERPDGA